MNAPPPLRVVFIGGYTRSGSTLLDRLVGSAPGVVSVGEVRHIWGMGFIENRFCGCGEPFRACPFWQAVIAEAFGGFEGVDAPAMRAAEERLFKARYLPRLARPGMLPPPVRRARRIFQETRARLLRAVATVSGATAVVDSSKNPSYGLLLAQADGLDVRTVHLIRDSRATSYSWTRVKADPRHAGVAAFFPRRHPAVSGTWWAANGVLMGLTGRLGPRRHLRVRYEDLIAEPGRVLGRIARYAEVAAPEIDGATYSPGVHHSIGGNPVRFEQGPLTLRQDAEWREAMGRPAKALVTAITWPLLLRYGYLGGRP